MEVKPDQPRKRATRRKLITRSDGAEEKKGCQKWLGATINKIEISNPNISLMNFIRTPPNYPIKTTLAITDSGANIHLARQATKKISLVII